MTTQYILEKVSEQAIELLNKTWDINTHFGISNEINLFNKNWSFRFDKANRRMGCCKKRQKLITLSAKIVLLNYEKNPAEIDDCIRHELAHALQYELMNYSDH